MPRAMRKTLSLFFLVVGSILSLTACGGAKGDACDAEGRVGGECDEGLVCGAKKSASEGELVCLAQCTTGADCEAGEDCAEVGRTSLKACRAR